MTFDELIAEAIKKHEEAAKFVSETGLCFVCKANKVEQEQLKCKECVDKTEKLLNRLRGTPGFVEVKVASKDD